MLWLFRWWANSSSSTPPLQQSFLTVSRAEARVFKPGMTFYIALSKKSWPSCDQSGLQREDSSLPFVLSEPLNSAQWFWNLGRFLIL